MLEPIYFREQLPVEHARDLRHAAARNHLLASLKPALRRVVAPFHIAWPIRLSLRFGLGR